MWDRFEIICNRLSKIIVFFAMTLVFLIMGLTVVDVLLRRLTPYPFLGMYEITEVNLASLVFLSLAYTWTVHGHIRVDLLVKRAPLRLKAILNIVSNIAGIIFFFGIAWIGFWDAIYGFRLGLVTDILRIPLIFPKLLLSVGCLIFTVVIFLSLVNSIRKFSLINKK